MLTKILKRVMDETINEFQGTFVKGPKITDMIFIANEVVEEHRRAEKKRVILKLDLKGPRTK